MELFCISDAIFVCFVGGFIPDLVGELGLPRSFFIISFYLISRWETRAAALGVFSILSCNWC